jgi:hypothetical protein
MSFLSKTLVLAMCGVGILLASSSDVEAGRRHRHRHGGHHGGGCYSAPASSCGQGCVAPVSPCVQAYAAPVSNGCCTTAGSPGYGNGSVGYGNPTNGGPASPSDLPATSPPLAPPATANPPAPATGT